MKRILSILLSVTIIATMLVSMSVTSFAADKVLYTAETPSEDIKFEIFFEKCDAATNTDMGLENGYLVTYTLSDYGTVNGWRASGKFNGTKLAAFSVALLFEDGCVPTAAWVDSSDIGDFDADNLFGAPDNYYEIVYGKPFGTAFPVVSSASPQEHSEPLSVYAYIDMPTDTFKVELGEAISGNNVTQFGFVDASNGAQSGLPRIAAAPTTPGVTVPFDFEKTYYVKDGVQVTKDEYEGGEVEPATHNITVYANGEELMNETIAEGEAITMPVAPAVTGKTFSHWATTEGGSAVEPATTMGTEDLTYYAVYTVNKYTITFVVDGNTTTKEVEHGTVPTFDGSLVKDGYTFTGWDKEIVAATGAATYTAQFEKNAPTQYEITFVVDGAETKVMTNAGETPVFPGTPAKDGYNFLGWNPTLAPATGAATYTAQFELIPVEPEASAVEITTVSRITGDIFPESGEAKVTVVSFGNNYTVSAARLHRVHTTFDYDASVGTLKEMGMLFVPKAVADEAGASTAEAIVAAGIAKDANCRSLPAEITGGTTGVIFKAGLVDVPEEYKGITIYAIPYYTLSGGARQYHGVVTTTF